MSDAAALKASCDAGAASPGARVGAYAKGHVPPSTGASPELRRRKSARETKGRNSNFKDYVE
eukprot:295889-Chlamydomonas_euryale.AAC.1